MDISYIAESNDGYIPMLHLESHEDAANHTEDEQVTDEENDRATQRQIYRARENYIETVTDAVVAWLRRQSVYVDDQGAQAIADAIRFHSK